MGKRIGFPLSSIITDDLHVVDEDRVPLDQDFVMEADMGQLMEEGEPKIVCPIISERKPDDRCIRRSKYGGPQSDRSLPNS